MSHVAWYRNHITTSKQTQFERDWEIGNPPGSLLLLASPFHSDNVLCKWLLAALKKAGILQHQTNYAQWVKTNSLSYVVLLKMIHALNIQIFLLKKINLKFPSVTNDYIYPPTGLYTVRYQDQSASAQSLGTSNKWLLIVCIHLHYKG